MSIVVVINIISFLFLSRQLSQSLTELPGVVRAVTSP